MATRNEVPLGDIVTFQRGFDLPANKRKNGKVPVIGSNGIVDYHNELKVKNPGLVIGRSGNIGNGFFIDKDFWPLNTTLWVKDFHNNNPLYCYYLIKNIDFSVFNAGSGVPTLNRNHIHPLPVLFTPDINEQEIIAFILGSLDKKIELNRQMNKALEEMARAIFKSWFIDFDPVHAKAEGREPFGMDAETAALFPDEFEDSELGMIPKGWKTGYVGSEFEITMGQSPPGSSFNNNGRGIEFFQGKTDFGFRYPKPRVYTTSPTRYSEKGNTLVSVRAPVGDINMTKNRCCIGRGLASVIHNTRGKSYTYYALNSLYDRFKFFDLEGTVFGCINKKGFDRMKIIIPNTQIVAAFEAFSEQLDLKIEVNDTQSELLARVRNELMVKLISGEIRIDSNLIDKCGESYI